MKILVLNGSPKGERSNTMELTKAFCEGIGQRVEIQTEIVPVYQKKIQDCLGCFRCWSVTPGTCCLQDDVAGIIEQILEADLIIWSFPLYYFGLPSRLKALMDRQLPMSLPFMSKGKESGGHPGRYDLSGKRYAAISTCGFYTPQGNYDGVNTQFDRIYDKDGYISVYCGEGELFRVPALRKRVDEYLSWVRRAGREFAVSFISPASDSAPSAAGPISSATWELLTQPLVPRDAFEEMADADWGVRGESTDWAERGEQNGVQPDPSLNFTRQMAAFYNKGAWGGRDRVVEFYYRDVEQTYQILLQKEGHQVLTRGFLPYTTRIETSFSLWRDIAEGRISGQQALMEHRYTVKGDFGLMLHWDEVFGIGAATAECPAETKKTNMCLMLAPWITIWVLLAIRPAWGGVAGILAVSALPLAFLKWKPTVFEGITAAAVAGIGLLALYGCSVTRLLPLSYLLFGLLWTGTVFCRLPLSAYYSINNFRGRQEWENPLFLRTNRILTACWGALYLVTPLWTYFLLLTPFAPWTGAVNLALPVLLGIFTAWFQRWYPAYYAGRGI